MVQKEELLKQSKTKLATVESVKLQIDTLMKVKLLSSLYRPFALMASQAAADIQKKVDELVPPLVLPSQPTTPAPS